METKWTPADVNTMTRDSIIENIKTNGVKALNELTDTKKYNADLRMVLSMAIQDFKGKRMSWLRNHLEVQRIFMKKIFGEKEIIF